VKPKPEMMVLEKLEATPFYHTPCQQERQTEDSTHGDLRRDRRDKENVQPDAR